MRFGRTIKTRNPTRSTDPPDPDPIATAITERMMIMTDIIKAAEDIPEVRDPHVIMGKNHTPGEVDLMTEVDIIMEKTEEVLLKTEAISRDMTKDKDLGIDTDPMDVKTAMAMLLHSEVMEEEDTHLFKEKAEETSLAMAISLTEEGNHRALATDTLMVTGMTDTALDVTEGDPETIRDKTDSHQPGKNRINSAEGQLQEKVEMSLTAAGDVGTRTTSLYTASNFRIGGGNPVLVDCCTKDETATSPMEPT